MINNINASMIKELRERTGASIMICKKMLVESQGDIELAIDNMRKTGKNLFNKEAIYKIATEGMILAKIHELGHHGIIIEVNCETDFVAQDSSFKLFCEKIIIFALNDGINNIDMLRFKFEDQRSLLAAKVGENINIRRIGVLNGDVLGSYLHVGSRIGVIVSASNIDQELVKKIAMHIAASKPKYIKENDIPANIIEHEYQIQLDIAMQSGKSREISEKIAQGRMNKFINEISLVNQNFVMDQNKTIGQLLNEQGAKIDNFIRFELGEGIKKIKVDFAKEVNDIRKNFS